MNPSCFVTFAQLPAPKANTNGRSKTAALTKAAITTNGSRRPSAVCSRVTGWLAMADDELSFEALAVGDFLVGPRITGVGSIRISSGTSSVYTLTSEVKQ